MELPLQQIRKFCHVMTDVSMTDDKPRMYRPKPRASCSEFHVRSESAACDIFTSLSALVSHDVIAASQLTCSDILFQSLLWAASAALSSQRDLANRYCRGRRL